MELGDKAANPGAKLLESLSSHPAADTQLASSVSRALGLGAHPFLAEFTWRSIAQVWQCCSAQVPLELDHASLIGVVGDLSGEILQLAMDPPSQIRSSSHAALATTYYPLKAARKKVSIQCLCIP